MYHNNTAMYIKFHQMFSLMHELLCLKQFKIFIFCHNSVTNEQHSMSLLQNTCMYHRNTSVHFMFCRGQATGQSEGELLPQLRTGRSLILKGDYFSRLPLVDPCFVRIAPVSNELLPLNHFKLTS